MSGKPVKIWSGVNIIPDETIPEGYVGIDGAHGLELIKLEVDVPDVPVPTYEEAIEAARNLTYKLNEATGEMCIDETEVYLMIDRLWGIDPFAPPESEDPQ